MPVHASVVCRAIAAQTIDITKNVSGEDIYTIALIELAIETGTLYDVSKIQERHFKLVPHSEITPADLGEYRKSNA